MNPAVTFRRAISDPQLLGGVLGGESWHAWRSLLLAALGEALEPDELATFTALTGRLVAPIEIVQEFLAVIGRRGGKTRSMAALMIYLGGLCDWHDKLAVGERGVVLLIAPDTKQARIALDYAQGILESTAILSQLIAGRTVDTLSLTTGIDLEVRAASFRRMRGATAVAVLADECAFWLNDESANPDTEILNAARPMLATTGGPLIMISSPYARKGEVWQLFREHHGPEGDPSILVAQGTSRDLNPTLPQRVVDRAMERDRSAASAEYLAIFRDDLETFVPLDVVEACVDLGVHERGPMHSQRYFAFVDPSGGSSDSMTLAIGHREAAVVGRESMRVGNEIVMRPLRNELPVGTIVVDCIREVRPPFSPEAVVVDFCNLLDTYKVRAVRGDRYGGEFCREPFRRRGIAYELAEKPKSDLFRDLLPHLNGKSIILPDNSRLIAQLAGLERRVSRAGKDSIDHPPGHHDDIANVVAGLTSIAAKPPIVGGQRAIDW